MVEVLSVSSAGCKGDCVSMIGESMNNHTLRTSCGRSTLTSSRSGAPSSECGKSAHGSAKNRAEAVETELNKAPMQVACFLKYDDMQFLNDEYHSGLLEKVMRMKFVHSVIIAFREFINCVLCFLI